MSSVPTPSDHALQVGSSAAHRRFPRAALLRVASDERLVELVRGGSEAAFEAIYDRHHRGILAFCRHMLASADEGEDALQHTFMAAYRHLADGSAEIQLRPWLYAIARNRCLTMLRARRERPLGDHEAPATEHLSTEAQRRQDVRDLLGDVARLPEDQRAALVLAELGAVSHDEIALVLNVPRQKVKALVFQARTSLAASRKARETPCEEIREQLANLRGGALRRTTLHRHLRECAGCRAFRSEVALQRKTLAVALPVIPTVGLKEAALGAAFGSGTAGGGAALGTSTLAVKALVTVALVGGGTTAGVEAARHAVPMPKAAKRSAPAAPAATVIGFAATARHISSAPLRRSAPAAGARPQPAPPGKSAAPPRARMPKPATPVADVVAPGPAYAKPADAEPAPPPAPPKAEKPASAPKPAKAPKPDKAPKPAQAPKPVKAPPGQAKKAEPKQQPPGQAKKVAPPAPAAPKVPPGQAKKLVPPSPPKVHGKHP
jgi:RNA polymerase sigma factor (sigma-70 family)